MGDLQIGLESKSTVAVLEEVETINGKKIGMKKMRL